MVIKCPECNHFVSDTSTTCPHCGYVLKKGEAEPPKASNPESAPVATQPEPAPVAPQPEPAPVVLSVIFKHRGMAYFAQNMYDNAISDFKKSVESDPKNFRSIYYEGIVNSVQGKDIEAIECFDRSLAIDSFQSHVYYRRSLAYYNLGEYAKAVSDINNAINLGLEDDDVKELKAKLIKKFDMGM